MKHIRTSKGNKMKIGLITFHFAHNNGALLQCFGLYKYLESCGHTVEIIDYRPPYHEQLFVKNPNPFVLASRAYKEYSDRGFIYRAFRYIKRVIGVIAHYNDEENKKKGKQLTLWQQFVSKHFVLTRKYINIAELKSDPPVDDIYISGSDQLWNPFLTNYKPDEAYYLQFGDDRIRKITYAISACMLDVDKYSEEIKRYCEVLDGISLREEEKRAEIEKNVGKAVEICPDPTFLIDVDDYCQIYNSVNIQDTDYMLVYLMQDKEGDHNNIDLVQKLAGKLNVKCIDISMFRRKWNIEVEEHQGVFVDEYLAYIKNAKYVVTNSFHCTVFSANFHKRFITLPILGKSSRTKELLELLGLQSRMVNNNNTALEVLCEQINYGDVDIRRKELQKKGRDYLEMYLS